MLAKIGDAGAKANCYLSCFNDLLCVYFDTKPKLFAPLPVHLTDLFEPHTTGTTENNSFASFEKGKAAKLISEKTLPNLARITHYTKNTILSFKIATNTKLNSHLFKTHNAPLMG